MTCTFFASFNFFDEMGTGVWIPINLTLTTEGVHISPLIVADEDYPIWRWLMMPYNGALSPEQPHFQLCLQQGDKSGEVCIWSSQGPLTWPPVAATSDGGEDKPHYMHLHDLLQHLWGPWTPCGLASHSYTRDQWAASRSGYNATAGGDGCVFDTCSLATGEKEAMNYPFWSLTPTCPDCLWFWSHEYNMVVLMLWFHKFFILWKMTVSLSFLIYTSMMANGW